MDNILSVNEGSGGEEMQSFIDSIRKKFINSSEWGNLDNDGATFPLDKENNLVFTTDTFTVSPLFFPGGNIGDISFAGTVNDLVVMGADPIGISMGLVAEEGMPKDLFNKIIDSFSRHSKDMNIPLVTGDTKVVEKGKVDKIFINTSGVGLVKNKFLLTQKAEVGDKIIVSGGIGEHSVALLSERFDFETELVTDSKPLVHEMASVRGLVKQARDPTRGGLSAALTELSDSNNLGIKVDESSIPIKNEVNVVSEMLGLNPLEMACEGRVVCICKSSNAQEVLNKLKEYNTEASIIGEMVKKKEVILATTLGERPIKPPKGQLIPRIC
ncbi:MAG: hydrogenase expression/formation protein HypE [Nanobdellota archaeon]